MDRESCQSRPIVGGIIQRNLLTVGRWKRTSEAVQRPGVVAKNLYRRGAKSWGHIRFLFFL
ncbi:hypothetical protein OUZ56_002858 [Daphnia magna]|uniref:Uncharacterized protein n=1 Tax=Daphnia magna TaxID=35525 RepID=A0ABR0A700_9CRUS|nr:hypothetical protein OUZ56_002858 [Daphnia magna]